MISYKHQKRRISPFGRRQTGVSCRRDRTSNQWRMVMQSSSSVVNFPRWLAPQNLWHTRRLRRWLGGRKMLKTRRCRRCWDRALRRSAFKSKSRRLRGCVGSSSAQCSTREQGPSKIFLTALIRPSCGPYIAEMTRSSPSTRYRNLKCLSKQSHPSSIWETFIMSWFCKSTNTRWN